MKPTLIKSQAGKIQVFCKFDALADPRSLKLNPKNPNKHPRQQLKMFGKIFVGVGFRRAITVSNQSGMVVKGHGATLGAIEIGMEKVPVEYQDYPDTATELADLSADNQLAELSENDTTKLKELLDQLPDSFDKELTGFWDKEIQDILANTEIKIVAVEIKPTPKMAWALVGVPIHKFAAVQKILDQLPDSAIVHVTANDKEK